MGSICGERNISENLQLDRGRSTPELQSTDAAQLDYVLDLRTVLKVILKWSWITLLLAAVGLVYGVLETAKFVPQYTAKMIIAPQTRQGDVGERMPQSGGRGIATTLAVALGNSGGGAGVMFQRLQFVLKSHQLARRLDEQHGLSREIFASRWDSEKGAWKTVVKAEPTLLQRLGAYLHQDQSVAQGTEALALAVGGMVEFVPIKETEFWEMRVSHTNRDTALRWLKIIFTSADRLLRAQDRETIREQIRFLRTRTEKADLEGFRAALYGALIDQEKKLHMIDSDLIYSTDIIEPAFTSDLKTMPNLLKTIVAPAVGGGFFGLIIILFLTVFFRE